MMRLAAALSSVLLFVSVTSLSAAEQKDIEALLKREIVGPVLPQAEVQRYCEQKVLKMPEVGSAAEWQTEAARLRADVLEKIVYRGQAAKWRDAKTKVVWLDTIEGGPGYHIKKLRYEALPGLWIPALLYEPDKLSGKVPAVLNVNGHGIQGKQNTAKQLRCINLAKRGMLALNIEWLGKGQLREGSFGDGKYRHLHMHQLDLCGTSGLAPFYLNMKRAIDVLLSLENTDPDRVAVSGLSGGGWQTITISSLDTRVKLANPVAGYSSLRTRERHFKDMGDSEQMPNDLGTLVDYTHLTAMMAPRPTLLTYNSKDECCFESGYAMKPLTDAAAPVFRLLGKKDALRTHVNDDPGTHNYEVDNRQAFYRMLGDFFYTGDDKFNRKEIPSEKEIKSEEELAVAMPEENEDFHTLAMALCKQLPANVEDTEPEEKNAAAKWRRDRRAKLTEIVRAKRFKVGALKSETETLGDVTVNFWRLQMDGDWTLPATEFVRGEPNKTAILASDTGRATAAADVQRLLASGHRVIAVDPFYFGESRSAQRAFQFTLLMICLGDRPLGLQASQLAAVARWTAAKHENVPVTLVGIGPRSSTFALIAAALEEKAVTDVELHRSLSTLKEVIEENWLVTHRPEMFCFGLLETFDIKQIAALVAPRPVKLVGP